MPVVVQVGDLTIGEFSAGVPDAVPHPETRCYGAADVAQRVQILRRWRQWEDQMLAKALRAPRLTPEQVQRLGPDRPHLLHSVLTTWGISVRGEPLYRQVYAETFIKMVRRLARFSRRLPSEILALPVRDFWLNWLVLFGGGAEVQDTAALETEDDLLRALNG